MRLFKRKKETATVSELRNFTVIDGEIVLMCVTTLQKYVRTFREKIHATHDANAILEFDKYVKKTKRDIDIWFRSFKSNEFLKKYKRLILKELKRI